MAARTSSGDRDTGKLLHNFPVSRSPSKVSGGVAAVFFAFTPNSGYKNHFYSTLKGAANIPIPKGKENFLAKIRYFLPKNNSY
jgi:hypothetical protein